MCNRIKHNSSLWKRLGQNDPTALDALFTLYASFLFQYGMSISPHREQVKDALQDVFLNIWERRNQLPEIQDGERYLAIAIKRVLLRKYPPLRDEHAAIIAENLEPSVEVKWIDQENSREQTNVIRQIIESLPTRQKEIIYLKFYRNFSYAEISEWMNINQQAARNTAYKAIKKLKKFFPLKKNIAP